MSKSVIRMLHITNEAASCWTCLADAVSLVDNETIKYTSAKQIVQHRQQLLAGTYLSQQITIVDDSKLSSPPALYLQLSTCKPTSAGSVFFTQLL